MIEILASSSLTTAQRRFSRRPVAGALVVASLLAPLAASAATIQVTSNGNGLGAAGVCTLRSAVAAIAGGATNAACTAATGAFGTADTITFAPAVTLINFDSYGNGITLPDRTLTIQGTGFGGVTLQRTAAAASTFSIVVSNSSGPALTLNGLTIEGGSGSFGGGVRMNSYGGDLTISNSVIRNNTAGTGGGVGGAYGGSITINNSAITGNTATNSGGGVYMVGAFDLVGTTLSGNTSANWGGGAYLQAWCADGRVANTTISGNSTTGNFGGGLVVDSRGSCVASTARLFNNTITANNTAGGGTGTGLNCYGGNITLSSNILYGNSGSDVRASDCAASGTPSLTGVGNIVGVFGAAVNGGVYTGLTGTLSGNPLLAPLANNGGSILTHALLAGSPAINAGSNPGALANDARGVGYARVVGAAADIGAFEFGAGVVVTAAPTVPVPATGLSALFAGALGVLVTAFGALRRRRRQ